MFKIISPGPLPKWPKFTVEHTHADRRQWARIGCWTLAWEKDGETWLRPIFGGAIVVVECAGAESTRVQPTGRVRLKLKPLIPLARGYSIRLLQFGEIAREVTVRAG